MKKVETLLKRKKKSNSLEFYKLYKITKGLLFLLGLGG